MITDTRWKQRFQNYEKSWQLLERLLATKEPNEGERMGIIQAFEMTFELAWHLLGDYLKAKGFEEKSPRDILKQAFHNDLIADGEVWMQALTHRNLTSHLYDEQTVRKIERSIRISYAQILEKLYQSFLAKRDNE